MDCEDIFAPDYISKSVPLSLSLYSTEGFVNQEISSSFSFVGLDLFWSGNQKTPISSGSHPLVSVDSSSCSPPPPFQSIAISRRESVVILFLILIIKIILLELVVAICCMDFLNHLGWSVFWYSSIFNVSDLSVFPYWFLASCWESPWQSCWFLQSIFLAELIFCY